ncbi:MAG: hypothetical protein QMC82_08545 [Methanolinea sp.]|nr:hypothetical protein [Methanolinea sp.]
MGIKESARDEKMVIIASLCIGICTPFGWCNRGKSGDRKFRDHATITRPLTQGCTVPGTQRDADGQSPGPGTPPALWNMTKGQ